MGISPQQKPILRGKEGETVKKIVLTRNVMIDGKPYGPSDTASLPDQEATYLVNIGKAEWPRDKKKKAARRKETADSKAAKQSEKR